MFWCICYSIRPGKCQYGRAHRFYTIWAAGVASLLLALVLTLSLCVNAIAEPAGGSNEPAQGTEQTQEPEQTQSPKAQMVKFGMSKGDPDVTTDSLKPNDAVTIMLRDSGFTPPELGVQYGEPFAVAEGGGMLRCDRYPQEGGNGQKWYFRLCVSRGALPEGEVYTVYLPYSYLGIRDADAQKLIASSKKAPDFLRNRELFCANGKPYELAAPARRHMRHKAADR